MECKSCTITFKFPSIYIKHYQDKHGTLPPEYVDKENFICDQCPSVFISKQNLRDHILRVHMKKKKKTYRNTENGMEYIDAIKCTSCKQGNLLRGIDNCSVAIICTLEGPRRHFQYFFSTKNQK